MHGTERRCALQELSPRDQSYGGKRRLHAVRAEIEGSPDGRVASRRRVRRFDNAACASQAIPMVSARQRAIDGHRADGRGIDVGRCARLRYVRQPVTEARGLRHLAERASRLGAVCRRNAVVRFCHWLPCLSGPRQSHVARLVDRRARANLPGAAHVLGRRLSHRRGDRRLDDTSGRFRKRATAMGIRLRYLRSVDLHRPAGTCPLDRGQPPRRQHGDPRVDRARRGRARRTRACAVHGRRRQADRAGADARRIERPSSQLSGSIGTSTSRRGSRLRGAGSSAGRPGHRLRSSGRTTRASGRCRRP